MRVLLVDLDYGKKSHKRFVPLALTKLFTYHRKRGDDVAFTGCQSIPDGKWNLVCFSPLFLFKMKRDIGFMKSIQKMTGGRILAGGISPSIRPDIFKKFGFHVHKGLDKRFESEAPDFDACNVDKSFSYGFTSRGCTRHCEWCVVPKIEGKIQVDDRWTRYLKPDRRLFCAMDNNILAVGPDWFESVLAEIKKQNKKIDVNQAMDCRIFAKSDRMKETMVKYGKTFDVIRFAWDSSAQDKTAPETAKFLNENKLSKRSTWLMLYGNGESITELYNRILTLVNHGCNVKPMRFRDLETGAAAGGWYQWFANYVGLISGSTGLITRTAYDEGLLGTGPEHLAKISDAIGSNLSKVRKQITPGYNGGFSKKTFPLLKEYIKRHVPG